MAGPILPPDFVRLALVALIAGGSTGIGTNVLSGGQEVFTKSDAVRFCFHLIENIPPLKVERRIHGLEEHERITSGYVPPPPSFDTLSKICQFE